MSRFSVGRHDYPYFRAVWNRVVFTMLAAALVPILLLGGVCCYYTEQLVKEKRLETLKVIALDRKIAVDRYLDGLVSGLTQTAAELAASYPGTDSLSAAFHALQQAHQGITELAVFDEKGLRIGSVGRQSGEGSDANREVWFNDLLARGVAVSEVMRGSGNEPYFLVAVRVPTPTGREIFRSAVSASRLNELASTLPRPWRGKAYLTNREGILQTEPEAAGQLRDRSPVQDLGRFDGIRMEESAGVCLLKVWQERAPWLNVIQVARSDLPGLSKRVYLFALLVFVLLAVPIVGLVLLTGNDLAFRLEAKTSSLKALDRQLRRASYMASSMELSMGYFRDIKDILGNIDTTAMVMAEEPEVSTSPDLQGSIAVVRSEVQRGQQAVERFLRYIEPQSPLIIEVDVHKLLDDLFQILDRELLFRSISVRRVFQADLPTVRSDSSKLRQVFLNIVINAVEAIDKDGEITLTSEVVENGLAVTVSDNGPGISAADLKRIFEPLWTTRSQGTGLGLPLCRQILEKLDGEITIQSALGKGTAVTVTLPLRLRAQRIPSTAAES